MLDDLPELRTLQQIAVAGSLSGAARRMGLSLAVVSKRLATLERRVGVRLVNRTTRHLSMTEEGVLLMARVERALDALREGEAMLLTGRDEPVGTLRVSAPISFGRRHVAPVLAAMAGRHPRLSVFLSLDDRLVDVAGGEVDVAIRIGADTVDSSAAMHRLAGNRRILVAAPGYLDRHGRPDDPDGLSAHVLLRYGDAVGPWRLYGPGDGATLVPAPARLRADDGDTVQDWCVAGHGIAAKSELDVNAELSDGRLERVLPDWHAGERPVAALFPARAGMPRKTRMFIEAMDAHLASSRRPGARGGPDGVGATANDPGGNGAARFHSQARRD
ncbi:LysR substrate-binding domain-containing protein [Rhizosaccharibacter radicis]|uniref:LysR substrate-binding domain-containing protein n=1 Tax=Rhizosaccharibacter radicis TaxID=2782605 RepID=A0ABT1VSQ7_9PROT|nr:LysR substrate-binding domain-containing protein [Acetobacteraceae bacterium KSS12]